MKKACLAVVFAVLLSGSAHAAALLDRWDAGVVASTLRSLGASDVKEVAVEGQAGVLARTPEGLNVGVYAEACSPTVNFNAPVCRGLEGIVSYDPGAGADRAALVDRLNHDFAAGKFMVERDGTIRLTRYLNLDAGVTPANLRVELSDFFAVAAGARQTVWATPAH